MLCYRDMSFCEDACTCPVPENECDRKLTKEQNDLACSYKLPIVWMSFKDTCKQYKGVTNGKQQRYVPTN